MKPHYLLFAAALSCSSLHAESWSLTDGTTFEAKIRLVTPDLAVFTPGYGPDRAVEIQKLTAESLRQLTESLGLSPQPPTLPTAPVPEPPAPRLVPLDHPGRDPKAMDATKEDLIDSQYGLKGKVVGVVKEVVTLGRSGHKKLTFEGTAFNVFISKRYLEKSSDWKLEGLAGKTVQITGEIAKYQEVVQIAVKEPTQIEVLP